LRPAAAGIAAASLVGSLAFGAPADGGPAPARPGGHATPVAPATRSVAPAAKPVPPAAKLVPPVAKPAPPAKPVPPPPIVFFLAKGDANACGLGCSEWIAAEGTMDVGADDRLRALLKKIGKRTLPIFFHSPGGAIPAGLGIGRILRQHAMTAGVGRTNPAGCDPKVEREPACDKLRHSGRELVAELDTTTATCNSACVIALVGATVRDVGPSVRLGIHSASIKFTLRRIDAKGHVTSTPTQVSPKVESRALEGSYERLAAYLHEMGIAPGLLEAARKIPSQSVRYLTRDEIVAFGIDKREEIDGLWVLVEQPSGASALKIVQLRVPAGGAFRRVLLRVSCASTGNVHFQFAHEVGSEKPSLPVRYRLKAGTIELLLGLPVTVKATLADWLPLEVSGIDLPIAALGEPAFVIGASAAWSPHPNAVDPGAVTARNVGSGLASLGSRCTAPPPPPPSSAVQHI
jgi:hypothetical protein